MVIVFFQIYSYFILSIWYRVLGPTAVLQLAERDEPPPANSRPLYSLAMRGAVICFSGFRKKEELVSTF